MQAVFSAARLAARPHLPLFFSRPFRYVVVMEERKIFLTSLTNACG
jgi:hypothetical protein